MGDKDRRWGVDNEDEDTGELPNEVLQVVLARIRAEEMVRRRALRAARRAPAQPDTFDIEGSLDAPHDGRRRRPLWSPRVHFAGLTVLASASLGVIWWMLL